MLDISIYRMRQLCIENDWFTCGTNEQYGKLFSMIDDGCTLDDAALVIWVCSDSSVHTLEGIKTALQPYMKEE